MNKRENVIKLMHGEAYDFVPAGFWIHFDKTVNQGSIEDKAQAHLHFAQAGDLSVVKVMNENEFRRKDAVQKASDWGKISVWSPKDSLFAEQREISNRVVDLLDGDYYSIGTVHGLVASLSHSSGLKYAGSLEVLLEHAQQNKQAVLDAIKATTENVINMLNVAQETAVDGIYYAALGGEADRLPREFYEEFIAPYDLAILKEVRQKPIFLHICKTNIDFDRFSAYPADVVNWPIYETGLSLTEGADRFENKVILGGLDDRSGVLVEGSEADIQAAVSDILDEMQGRRFILGADCTLPTEIDYARIQTAATFAREA